ncbi:Hypothetical predicted protein [Lecanosticta acicola]|uniref:Glycosyltransferase 2-like domain-containing protein n=1 Tax=Lecanosticta acicola TaxID=111012 RepID=A0AAI8Z3V6_9PEZI|nr:Hypothetical predicted protein [Lecanosticta acicola]
MEAPSHSIAVVIPTLNEVLALPKTVRRLYQSANNPDSIAVVIVDASPDEAPTRACLSPSLSTDPSLHLVHYSGQPSRGLQMNFGAAHASNIAPETSVLLFLHADTLLPPSWDTTVLDALYRSPNPPLLGCFKLALPPPLSLSLRIMLWCANKRAELGNLPYGDQCYFITRRGFQQVGGFPPVPIMEDVGLLRRVSQHGGLIRVVDVCVETSKRRWERNGVIWNTILNQFFMTAWLCGTPPDIIYRWYYGPRMLNTKKRD